MITLAKEKKSSRRKRISPEDIINVNNRIIRFYEKKVSVQKSVTITFSKNKLNDTWKIAYNNYKMNDNAK